MLRTWAPLDVEVTQGAGAELITVSVDHHVTQNNTSGPPSQRENNNMREGGRKRDREGGVERGRQRQKS